MRTEWKTRLIHSEARVPEGFHSLVSPVFRGSRRCSRERHRLWIHGTTMRFRTRTACTGRRPHSNWQLASRSSRAAIVAWLRPGGSQRLRLVALDNTWAAGVLFDAFGHGVDCRCRRLQNTSADTAISCSGRLPFETRPCTARWGSCTSTWGSPCRRMTAYGQRLVRFYIGLEDPGDLISDLEQAFG
jgi:hypothetical protein